MKLDLNAAWDHAVRLIAANREVMLVLAGVFFFLPYVLFLLLVPVPEFAEMAGSTGETNPAVMAAIGMFSGYCGTLMTPMAANFNIVPAALLELPDKNAVIKAQIPTGILLLIVNVFLLYFLMFL